MTRLYILKPIAPETWTEKCKFNGFVIRAESAQEARKMAEQIELRANAAKNQGLVVKTSWGDNMRTSCEILFPKGYPEMILAEISDF